VTPGFDNQRYHALPRVPALSNPATLQDDLPADDAAFEYNHSDDADDDRPKHDSGGPSRMLATPVSGWIHDRRT